MLSKSLSSLSVKDMDVVIEVQVNRKWEYRGATDDGPIMHIDMILTENTGDAIYAEIPTYLADEKSPLLEINKVYKIRRFKVAPTKSFYRVIDGPHMIYITPYTIIETCQNPPATFLEYVYHLSSYNEIDPYGPKAKDFHDVIEMITETSHLEPVPSKTRQNSTVKRDVLIQDLRIIAEQITSQLPPLSNEEIIPCEPFKRKHRQLNELLDPNPYDLPEQGCEVTVTITKILENKIWWYVSCNKCPNKVTLESTTYKCTRCGLTTHTFRYKLGFMASDGTAEAKMFCFDDIAKVIIGKSCSSIIGSTSDTRAIPPEIATIVSLKFTFAVIFNKRSFSDPDKVLLIKSIVGTHGREHRLPQIEKNIGAMHPSTPVKLPNIATHQESPSLPMSRLSTDASSSVSRTLLFSPPEHTTPINSPTDITLNQEALLSTKTNIHESEAALSLFESPPKRIKQQDKKNRQQGHQHFKKQNINIMNS